MTLRSHIARTRRAALSALARRDAVIRCDRPLISFTFDDFPRTALTVGGAILEDAGVRGTYYTAPGLMDTSNALGSQFSKQDLFDLVSAGHELASHTHSHASARITPFKNYIDEVERGYRTLALSFGLNPSRQFAYPFGEISFRAKKAVGSKMQSCRGVYPGLNESPVDLNLLRANSLYGDADQFVRHRLLIEENLRRKSWLIFYTHDVQPKPSPFGCTAGLLKQVVRSAVESGAHIATVAEVISLAQLGE